MPQEDRFTLKKMSFSKSIRGYSCDEVDTYMEYVMDKYEQVCKEYADVRRRLTAVAARESELRAEDDQVRKNRLEKCQESCDAMVDEAKRQAARILVDAEHEAELIIRHAEDEAQNIAANAAKERTRAQHEANRSIAAKNNLADRLVQEIDTFRKEVFAMYADHINALERLEKRTDKFYQQKNELTDTVETESVVIPVPVELEPDIEIPDLTKSVPEEVFEEEAAVDEEIFIGDDVDTSEDEVVLESAEYDTWEDIPETEEEVTESALWEDLPEAEETEFADETDFLPTEEDFWDAETAEVEDIPETEEDITESALWEDLLNDEEETEEVDEEEDSQAFADSDDDFSSTTELLQTLFGVANWGEMETEEDTYSEEDTDEEELTFEDTADILLTEEEPETEKEEEYDSEETENDMLLADLKAVYGTTDTESDDEEAESNFEEEESDFEEEDTAAFVPVKRKAVRRPQDLDDLFLSGDATNSTKDISLTGEFDIIYSKEKSLRNVEEIDKQPMVVPETPSKPKKHGKF